MYFWKTHLLANALKEKAIKPNEFKSYYFLGTLFFVIIHYLALLSPPNNKAALFVEAIGILGVTFFGLNAVFKANGGSNGEHFLEKIIALSVPLNIKFSLISFVVCIFIGVLKGLTVSYEFQTQWFVFIFSIVIQALFFWRLTVHVKNTTV